MIFHISKSKKGANALGIAGILITILLFELLASWVVYAVTNERVEKVFVNNCDCDYIGGCSTYVAVNGLNALINKCESQIDTNPVLKDSLSNQFFNFAIVGLILLVLNITIILIIILILRGVSA